MTLTPEITITQIAAALRSIRKARGWTLKEVEELSGGVWKAVVIGSYERCDRSLSLNKAVSLARFYEVPLDVLLGLTGEKAAQEGTSLLRTFADRYASSFRNRIYQRIYDSDQEISQLHSE